MRVRLRFSLLSVIAIGISVASAEDRPSSRNADISPRRPQVPAAPVSELTNPIDLILQPYFATHKIQPGAVVDDRTFARRVYLDLVGVLPTPEELATFQVDSHADKRARLVRQLL